jgi:membrane fusion protein (multidrug efflux system)
MLRRMMLVSICLGLISLSFVGCSKKEEEQTQQPAPLVQAVRTIKTDVPVDIEYPAQVAGSLEVEVRAQVGGILKERLYQEGEYVKKDSVLFVIDQEQYKIELERAKASLEQVSSEVQRTKRDYLRMKELIADNAVSQKDYDDSLSAYERAQANYKQAKTVVDDAQRNLNYTTVKAPISGIARKENHSVGSLISVAGDEALLTTMVQINPLYINFSLPAGQVANLKKQYDAKKLEFEDKIKVDIILPDNSIYKQQGDIIFFDSAEDPLTSTIAVKAEVKNPNYERNLKPGQFVKVKIRGITFKGTVIIPQSALIESPNGTVVYVIDEANNNSVSAVPVSAQVKDAVAIVYSGLKGGELVVSGGALKVYPGASVTTEIKEFVLPDNMKEAYDKQSAKKEETPICQSCGMPIEDERSFGTEADGSRNRDYCKYCYKNGKFNIDKPLNEFINLSAKYMAIENDDITEEQAKAILSEKLPKLKRWSTKKNAKQKQTTKQKVANKVQNSVENNSQQDKKVVTGLQKEETVQENGQPAQGTTNNMQENKESTKTAQKSAENK